MPSGKKLRTAKPESDESAAVADVPGSAAEEPAAENAEEPAAAAPEVEDEPAAPAVEDETPVVKTGRRRGFLRRRKGEPDAQPVAAKEAADEPDAEISGETTEPAELAVEAGDEAAQGVEGDADAERPEPVLVAHQPAGGRLKIAAAAAAALFVAGGAFLGYTAQPVIANRALVETKLDIARTAANAITTLWSYTPDNMDSLADRSARYLTGDFAAQYRKFIDSIVATNKQAQVTNTTSVLGTAVESVSQDEASAVVYTNSVATSPVSKNIPSLRYLSYRLEMKRDRSEWRITRMTTITTLDLTPQL